MNDAERETLERRIDELCQEVEQLRKTATMLANARTNLLAENAKLRELVDGLRYCANESHGRCAVRAIGSDLYASCCPLYDTSSGTYGCESLMQELGIEAHVKEDE